MVAVLGAVAESANDGQILASVANGRDTARQRSAASEFDFLRRFWPTFALGTLSFTRPLERGVRQRISAFAHGTRPDPAARPV
jgi:hypothetical protein